MSSSSRPTPPLTAGSSPTPDVRAAADVLERHAENPSAFLALNRDTRHFMTPEVDGIVAYRPAGKRTLVQLGGVFCAESDRERLLSAFLHFAGGERRRVIAVQLLQEDAELYARSGFTVNQIGADYARSLGGFSLAGKKHMQLRNKVSRARRAGVTVVEVGEDRPSIEDALTELDAKWLRSKGRHVKELAFMVGERGGPAGAWRRLFVALDPGGRALAYVSFSPAHGARSGWLHDLSRRHPDAPPGVLELVVVTAVERFRAEGAGYLHFGFTPFTSLDPAHEQPGHSSVVGAVVRLLASHGRHVYPSVDQLAYKLKWGPDLVQPEYVAFQGGPGVRAVWALLRLTNAA